MKMIALLAVVFVIAVLVVFTLSSEQVTSRLPVSFHALINVDLHRLRSDLVVLAGAAAGCVLPFVVYRLVSRKLATASVSSRALVPTTVTLITMAVAAGGTKLNDSVENRLAEAATTRILQATATAKPPRVVKVPDGFLLETVIRRDVFKRAGVLAAGPEGELYVGALDGVYKVDPSRPVAESSIHLFSGLLRETRGITVHGGYVWATAKGNLYRLADEDGDGVADKTRIIVSGLPHDMWGGHSANAIVFGPDGRIYLGLGGTSDHGPEKNEIAGSVLSIDPESGNFEVFAKGFRNPYGLAFCPDGLLYLSDNGPDNINTTLIYRPPDELNRVGQGLNYGYPDFYGTAPRDSGTEDPIALLPMSAGAAGITCYDGSQFPEEYIGNIFIALYGSYATLPLETGRRIVRAQPKIAGKGEVWEVSDFVYGPDVGNPVYIAPAIDGGIYYLDWENGEIMKVTYKAPPS